MNKKKEIKYDPFYNEYKYPKKKKNSQKIIKPIYNIIDENDEEDSSNSTIICKNCKKPFIYMESENKTDWFEKKEQEFFDCPNCNTKNTIKESKKILEDNFFNQKNEKQKITNKSRRTVE